MFDFEQGIFIDDDESDYDCEPCKSKEELKEERLRERKLAAPKIVYHGHEEDWFLQSPDQIPQGDLKHLIADQEKFVLFNLYYKEQYEQCLEVINQRFPTGTRHTSCLTLECLVKLPNRRDEVQREISFLLGFLAGNTPVSIPANRAIYEALEKGFCYLMAAKELEKYFIITKNSGMEEGEPEPQYE